MSQRASVEYDHQKNRHTLEGAAAVLPVLLDVPLPASLLDVGCGTGTWLCAALDMGVADVCGIDGIAVSPNLLRVSPELIRIRDLRGDWGVDRRFDLVLCLEVAEHLPVGDAPEFIRKLTRCGDRVFFSAANAWQGGQNHLNSQWPSYWQGLFNGCGFVCRDSLRWKIWDDERVEPWYRQNLFLAERNEAEAGREPRIPGVVHPGCMESACEYWRYGRQSLLEAVARWVDRGLRRFLSAASGDHGKRRRSRT